MVERFFSPTRRRSRTWKIKRKMPRQDKKKKKKKKAHRNVSAMGRALLRILSTTAV